jgi:hypothetical protein
MNRMPNINPYKSMLLSFNPDRVYGWEREVVSLLQLITATDTASSAIYGIRAIGKTTLLKYLRDERGALNKYRAHIGIDYQEGNRRLLWIYINFHDLEIDVHIFYLMYERLYDELEDSELLDGINADPPNRDEPKNRMVRILRRLIQQLDRKHQMRVVFLMDDFDVALREENHVDRNDDRLLRSISHIAVLIIATDDPISTLDSKIAHDSPLLGILKPEPLGLLSEEAACQLIREPAENYVQYNETELRMLLDVGGRQPFLLTAACEAYYDIRSTVAEADHEFDNPEYIAQLREQLTHRLLAEPHVTNVLNTIWNRHDKYHNLMLSMAHCQRNPENCEPEKVGDVRAAELATRAITYLDSTTNRYRLFSQLFIDYVLRQARLINETGTDGKTLSPARMIDGLPPIDRAVYEKLTANEGDILTFEDLIRDVWDEGDGTKRALEAAVHRLRRSIPPTHQIKNVRGKGYKYLAPEPEL